MLKTKKKIREPISDPKNVTTSCIFNVLRDRVLERRSVDLRFYLKIVKFIISISATTLLNSLIY